MQMRPMSLLESGHSDGQMSLAALLEGENQTGLGTHLTFEELLKRIVVGGWPELVHADEEFARNWLDDYLRQVIEVDIPEMGRRRNPSYLARLLESLGRGVGLAVKLSELARDVGGESGPIAHETVTGYPDALDRLNLIDDSPFWRPHMRSRTRLRAAPVRYFVDPSLATAALNLGTTELRADTLATGFHFEAGGPRPADLFAAASRPSRLLARRQRQRGRRHRDRARQQVGRVRDQAQPSRRRRRCRRSPPVRSQHRPACESGESETGSYLGGSDRAYATPILTQRRSASSVSSASGSTRTQPSISLPRISKRRTCGSWTRDSV